MEKKNLIREYASQVIAKEGYHNTTIQMIANQANISVGTIYNYFKSKKEILEYIFESENCKRINFIRMLNQKNLPIIDKVMTIVDYHFNELKDCPHTCAVLMQEYTEASRNNEKVSSTFSELKEALKQMMIEAQQKKEIELENPEVISTVIIHALGPIIYNLQYKNKQIDIDTIKGEITKFIINGLKC